ncbi:MAG TPA: hypothetical protein VGR50_01515 [Terriglobales bacterium]|nr:hypothetical protein [Terriglobales bacterium]
MLAGIRKKREIFIDTEIQKPQYLVQRIAGTHLLALAMSKSAPSREVKYVPGGTADASEEKSKKEKEEVVAARPRASRFFAR